MRKESFMKNKNRIIVALCLVVVLAFGIFALCACGDTDEQEQGPKKHKITVQSTEECGVSVDKTQAEFAETVTITLDLKVTDKYVERVTYNGKDASKRSENTYDFLMGNDDVTVAVELKPYQQLLISPNGFATFLTGNPQTLAKNNGTVDLTVSLNGSYMTILNWDIKSTNQAAIPGSSVKNSYTELTETGAISARVQTGNYDNIIRYLIISVDTDKIESGTTFLLIDIQNGNTSSQKASLVVPITVAEDIVTTKWNETLLFDISDLPSNMRQGKFNVYVTDHDFVAGSDNQEYQDFENVEADSDGKIKVEIEYVPTHSYFIAIWFVETDGSLTCYRILDTVVSGSTATGFNQLKNGMLTLISDGQTFTITVANEIVH